MIFGAIPPPRNFAKIHTRGGRGLQPEQPKDSIPPLGAQRNAAARCGGCAGAGRVRRKGGGVPRRAGRGGAFAGTAGNGHYAGRHGGRFRRWKPGRSFRAAGRQRGAGGAWPRGAHKGRVSGATALGGHVAGRRARAVYGGFPGRTRGRRKPGGGIRRAGRV